MNTELGGEFLDTNVLVYALDASAGAKHAAARALVERLWADGRGRLSVQVLQEFYAAVTGKLPQPLTSEEAEARIAEFATWRVYAPAAEDVVEAIRLQRRERLSFWDAMIVLAAYGSGCDVLWTEDLQAGRRIGGVMVRGPFAEAGTR
jgi:predicted nucleic acid-binding protein